MPNSPPMGCNTIRNWAGHCCEEKRETNLASKGSQEDALVNSHSATTSPHSSIVPMAFS